MPKEITVLFAPAVTFTRSGPNPDPRVDHYTDGMLHSCLRKAIANEEYEKATKFRDELKKRKADIS
jgi:hypothetical protein